MRLRTVSAAIALLSATLPLSHQEDHSGDPCAEISQKWAKADYSLIFPADLAQACLKSIPHDGERARFILEQLKLYFQFFSAQTYHKNPPSYFEVLPVDTNNTFQYFDSQLNGGVYKTNLEFDHDLMSFFGSYRHSAMEYIPACSGAFIFRNDHPLFAVAPEKPTDDPKIHVVKDPYENPRLGPEVDTINGRPAADYLHDLTKKLPDLKYIDPDARWNGLFFHRSNSDARLGAFAQRFIYPEGEQVVLRYKNGHEVTVRWTAEVFKGVAELTTDGEHLPWSDKASFLKNVCLRPTDPATCKTEDGLDTVQKRGLHTKKDQAPKSMWGYPTPVLHTHGHELSLFEHDEYSVLAISSFDPHPGNDQDGMAFIYDFQGKLHEALQSIKDKDKKLGKKRKLLVDLSHNDGGRQILAHEAVRMLLPDADHYFLANRRWSPALYDLMTAGYHENNNASIFNFRYFVDENGKDFKDAKDVLGPLCHDGDCFTKLMQSDHEQIMTKVFGQKYDAPKDSYWKPEDLVVVADGLCNGACAVVVEALQAQSVKVAAYGGRPGHKMQGAGGLKGHSAASFTKLHEEICYILGAGADNVHMPKPLPIRMLWGSVGLENRFRKGETTPMEFSHRQATWTHKFTKAMFDGAQAVWEDAYTLASNNAQADVDEWKDSEKKATVGSSKDQVRPQLTGTNNANNDPLKFNTVTNAVGDFMGWHLGKYIWEFFHAYRPEELFKVKDLLKDKELKKTKDGTTDDGDDDNDGDSEDK